MARPQRLLWTVFLCVVAVVGLSGQLPAQPQATSVAIEGTVSDRDGGRIPGATVALTREKTTLAIANTNNSGYFKFPSVVPGKYQVVTSLDQFKTRVTDVTVGSQPITLKIMLEVGVLTETVQVSSGGGSGGGFSRPRGVTFDRSSQLRVASSSPSNETYAVIGPNVFHSTVDEPLSTFAADVDTASYTNVRRFLNAGQLPPADAVRVEELLNYFRFPYAEPSGADPVSITTETGACPWAPTHRLVLVGVRARPYDDRDARGRNIVLLVDVSGSMGDPNKLSLVRAGLRLFVDTLRDADRIAMVVYAGSSGLALPSTPARERQKIRVAIEELEAGGSTNGGEGLILAYKIARENFVRDGVNRVILATDGDFNVGVTGEGDLLRLIEREKNTGVFLSVLGVGTGNLKNDTMEMLADKGNGHYSYLDSLQEARRVLVTEAGGTLETVAKDVKFQIEFNPTRVAAWQLIGYENRVLASQDFNDDRKDGGEIGAGHTVTVLYEIVPVRGSAGDAALPVPVSPLKYQNIRRLTNPAFDAELMTVNLRYKQPNGDTSQLMTRTVKVLEESPVLFLPTAAAITEFGLLLRDADTTRGRWTSFATRLKQLEWTANDSRDDRRDFTRLVEKAMGLTRR